MNYELAKKLKGAGFPMKKTNSNSQDFWGGTDTGGIVYEYPTLAELIDACGDMFYKLERYLRVGSKKLLWIAYGIQGDIGIIADNPEEAVANLWLELNTK